MKGFSRSSLFAMRQFYAFFSPQFEVVPQAVGQMPWGHVRTLLAKVKSVELVLLYAQACAENGWSRMARLKCYVVIELKAGEFKPEYVGKLNFYLSAVDDQLRGEGDQPTIGLILCKGKDKLDVEYALRDIHKSKGVSSFITKDIPLAVQAQLPTVQEIESELTALMHEAESKPHE